MPTACNYHPTSPAHFECLQCATAFCNQCISRRTHDQYGRKVTHYFCPKCNVEAQMLGVGNIVPPFWKRLPAFFLYPLKLQPLLFILILAGLGCVFAHSLLLSFLLAMVVLKYSYVVLRNTAQGSLTAPAITLATLNEELEQVFKQIIIIVLVFIGSGWIFAQFGPIAGILFWVVAILCLPAMIMSLAATNRLAHALNPVVFGTIILRIGSGYFLMYLFLLFLLGAPTALISQVGPLLPMPVLLFLFFAAKSYYMVMSYNLMGYALLQYHQEIGFEVDYEKFIGQDAAPVESPADGLLTEVEVLVKEGRIEEAIAAIDRDSRQGFTDLRVAERYYNLLKLKQKTEELLRLRPAFLELLVKENKKDKACEIFRECRAADKNFIPPAATLYKLAGWLAWRPDPKEALNSLLQFIKSYPDHPLLPEVYFFLAKFLHTRMDNHAKAREILNHLTSKYPDHDISGSVQKYIQQLA
jgi:tetratricopeptide (TPR) repeat protein